MPDNRQSDELFKMAQNSSALSGAGLSDNGKQKLEGMLKNLNKSDLEKLKGILGDEQKTKQLLSTPQAQALIKKLNKDKAP